MNKLLSYSYACALVLSLAACQNEEADIFDKSAAERLNEASELYAGRLTDCTDGWALEYYPNSTSDYDNYVKGVGYLMLAQFGKDYSVRIGMNNSLTDSKYDEDLSSWQVITDMGAVLSFNTHNRLLHKFSDPEDVAGTATDETGKGFLGDYEFVLVDVPEGGDYVTLKGKKSKAYSRLTRLSAGTDFAEYIADVQRMQKLVLANTAPNHLVMNVGEKQYNFIMPEKGGELGLAKVWPAGTDSTFTMTLNPLLVTRRVNAGDTTYVVRFRDVIMGAEESEVSAQEFFYDPASQSFVSETEGVNIVGEEPSFFFFEKWALGARFSLTRTSEGSEKGKELVANVAAGYSAIKYTLQTIQLQMASENSATLTINYRTNKNSAGKAIFNFNCSREGDNLKLTYVEPANSGSKSQYDAIAAIPELCNAFTGTFKIVVGSSPLNLTTIGLEKADDASVKFVPSYMK